MSPDADPSSDPDAAADDPADDASRLPVRRRTLLAGAGLAGAGVVGAVALGGDDGVAPGSVTDGSGATTDASPRRTTPVPDDEARPLAERFAPTLYFGRRERWFPTDPRPYTSERDGETVVDGFDALEGYTAAKGPDTTAPDPTVFYHVVEYSDRLAVVQYWLYSAFDQFSVNFHWHDWELLQAFVDRETDEAVLYVASAHSRTVPNNEFLDPDVAPAIISEVGSHSSALGMNERRDTFQRVSVDGLAADVTNGVLAVVSGEEELPFAYGLPRDEGFRLPYVVPELDGAPLTDHPRLPSVSAEDLVPADLTVRSITDLARPPTDLPPRERGAVFEPEARTGEGEAVDADEFYALVPTAEVEDIAAFTGPQLSFEFSVPRFAEDAVASHITTTSAPWTQPRYRDPLTDVTDSTHRRTVRERYGLDEGARGETVVGRVAELRPTDDVDVGVTLTTPPVEAVVRLASDPTAAPTFGGVAAFVDVEPGEHTLTVNAPGYAPYAQQVPVGSGSGAGTSTDAPTGTETGTETEPPSSTTGTETEATEAGSETASGSTTGGPVRVGAGGRVGLVPREDAVKLEVDAADRGGARRVRVEDDVAGRVFDAPPVQTEGRAGVYVHRAGGYTVEVTDERGETSVERVNPGPNQNAAAVAKARTGVSGVTRFLVEFLTETRDAVDRLLDRQRQQSESESADGTDGDDGTSSEAEASDTEADDGTTPTPDPDDASTPTLDGTSTPAADDTASIDLRVQSETDEGAEDDSTETPTATATPEPTDTPTPTATPESGDESTRRETAARDALRQALDEAVSRAEAANEAAVAGDDARTAEELRALRDVLARVSSVADRDDAPQPAARVAARRVQTADDRAARALDTLA